MDQYETLKQTYIHNLLSINDEELFQHHLPDMYFPSSMEILEEVLKKLENEIETAKKFIDKTNDIEEINFYKEEIKKMLRKIELINAKISKEIEQEQIEEDCLTNGKIKNIIFATTSRRIYVEEDIKDIPEDNYGKILECFHKLEQGYDLYNPKKQKGLQSELKGIHELKMDDIRLAYQILDGQTVYVIRIMLKKDDFSKRTRKYFVSRKASVEGEYKKLKEDIKDEEIKRNLISENEAIKQRIFEYLSSKKRGENNAQK